VLAVAGAACSAHVSWSPQPGGLPVGAGCAGVRIAKVTNPTAAAVTVYAFITDGSVPTKIGGVDAGATDEFQLAPTHESKLAFEWADQEGPTPSRHELGKVKYKIRCETS
jgi:hypothetical protein